MDADGLPLVGPGVDLSKVTAIHPKRMLAFLNHFIIHTTRFLNKFSCVCEQKLLNLNQRIQKLQVTMNILEAKLASIPGLENVTVSEATQPATGTDLPEVMQPEPEEAGPIAEAPAEAPPSMTVSQHPRYIKFFKMINMGVPIAALRNKVQLEGLNPDLLDTPDAPAPPMTSGDSSDSTFGSEDDDSDDDQSS